MRRRSDRRGKGILTSFWTGLTIVIVTWWLLLGGAIIWILPERDVLAAPTPLTIVAAGMTVRISQPDSPPFPIARDRAGFDAVRLGASAQDESAVTRGFATFEWIDVEDGQLAYVLTIDGDATQIELLEGEYAGERAWIRRNALSSKEAARRR